MRSYSYSAQFYAAFYERGKELSDRQYGQILRYVHKTDYAIDRGYSTGELPLIRIIEQDASTGKKI
ncbi:MAG: hypothetical protein LBD93_01640 [Treponema sp.]|jgi:hypothetical protein|nr:hypothetical protein [Treponema sp.]